MREERGETREEGRENRRGQREARREEKREESSGKRREENATEVLARVRNTVENINKHVLPPGIEVKPFYDRQVLLDITIGTVKHTLFFGISLVLAVLFFFLGNGY